MRDCLKYKALICLLIVANFSLFSQSFFKEDFEGAINSSTNLPFTWTKSTLSSDGGFKVGDSIEANYKVNGVSQWQVPIHTKFLLTNDIRCSYELGGSNCDKSKDRVVLPSIDLSNKSGTIILQFDAFFTGKLGSQASIEISTDNGVKWISVYSFPFDQSNWQSLSVDLTAYIGRSSVLVSFLYNDNNLVRDGLAIDNIDIKVLKPWKDVSVLYSSASNYSIIPLTQFDTIPLNLTVTNSGSLLLDSINSVVTIYDVTTTKNKIFSSSKLTKNLNKLDTIEVDHGWFIPTQIDKKYIIEHVVKTKSDTILSNDTLNVFVNTSKNVFARDYGNTAMLFDLTSSSTVTIGSVFLMKKAIYVDSINVGFIKSSNTLGTNFQMMVYAIKNGVPESNAIGKSNIYSFINSDTISMTFLKMTDMNLGRLKLDSGSYLVAVQKLANGKSLGLKLCENYYKANSVYLKIGTASFQTLDSYFLGTKKLVPKIQLYTSPYCDLSAKVTISKARCDNGLGSVVITPRNGIYPYQYYWNNVKKDSTITNVALGKYSLTVTDGYACSFDTINVQMIYQDNPIIQVDSIAHPTCFGSKNGYIKVAVTDPVPLKSIYWNNKQTNTKFEQGLPFGDQVVKVYNQYNCFDSLIVTLSQPDSISVLYSIKEENNASKGMIFLTVNGGIQPYKYLWSDGETVKNRTELPGDTLYSVSITDKNNCVKQIDFYIDKIVSLNTIEEEIVSIYPNPFLDFISVDAGFPITTYSIVDATGRVIVENRLNDLQQFELETSSYDRGAYNLILVGKSQILLFKIVKI
jgi:hypothetical protein